MAWSKGGDCLMDSGLRNKQNVLNKQLGGSIWFKTKKRSFPCFPMRFRPHRNQPSGRIKIQEDSSLQFVKIIRARNIDFKSPLIQSIVLSQEIIPSYPSM